MAEHKHELTTLRLWLSFLLKPRGIHKDNMKTIKTILIGVSAVLASTSLSTSYAGSYPERPIKIVLGFSAGGGTDTVLRLISDKLSSNLGVPVVVENKPGANGNIAGEIVAKAPNDGYTLLYNTSSMVLSPHLYTKLTYDYKTELTPVVLTVNIPLVLASHPKLGVETPAQFVSYLKEHDGSVNYASAGNGNITHLGTVRFLQAVGADAKHIPYRGESPALVDLIGGHVDFYMGTANGVIPHIQDKSIIGIAVTSAKRVPTLPDVPALVETILPDFQAGAWSGVMAPAGTPKEIVSKLNAAINKALKNPDVEEQIVKSGTEIKGSTVEEYATFLKSEDERWGEAVRAAGVKMD